MTEDDLFIDPAGDLTGSGDGYERGEEPDPTSLSEEEREIGLIRPEPVRREGGAS